MTRAEDERIDRDRLADGIVMAAAPPVAATAAAAIIAAVITTTTTIATITAMQTATTTTRWPVRGLRERPHDERRGGESDADERKYREDVTRRRVRIHLPRSVFRIVRK